jgi:7-keto-8-aminopelargonate synthetase-like enzyme
LNHASIVDGCEISKAQFIKFPHNDVAALRRLLEQTAGHRTLVVVDGVYSMEGDVAPLPEIVALCQQFGALLMVDEAHSLGVLGANGRGVQEYFQLADDAIDIKMGTLSKAIPSVGGFVAARREIIDYLKHHARGFIFSSTLPAAQVAAARQALQILTREPERVQRVQRNARRFVAGLKSFGLNVPPTVSPIVPVVFDSEDVTLEFTGRCRAAGLFVVPVFYPAVPLNAPRIRTTVLASHSDEDIDFALSIFKSVARDLRLFQPTEMQLPLPQARVDHSLTEAFAV